MTQGYAPRTSLRVLSQTLQSQPSKSSLVSNKLPSHRLQSRVANLYIANLAVDDESGQVDGAHQHPSVGLPLEGGRLAVVHGAGHIGGAVQILTWSGQINLGHRPQAGRKDELMEIVPSNVVLKFSPCHLRMRIMHPEFPAPLILPAPKSLAKQRRNFTENNISHVT